MADTFLFELVSPERLLFSQQVSQVVLPGSEGYLTVMAKHAAMMTTITPGIVTLTVGQEEQSFVVFGGFADICGDHCSLLAEAASPVHAFNREELKGRIKEAREALGNAPNDEKRNTLEDFLHQLTTVEGVLPPA